MELLTSFWATKEVGTGFERRFARDYDRYFLTEDKPHLLNPAFFDELLLLDVNVTHLRELINGLSEDEIVGKRERIRKLFAVLFDALNDKHQARVVHALETLSIIGGALAKKRFNDFNFTFLELVCGIQAADPTFAAFFKRVSELVTHEESPPAVRAACVKVVFVFCTLTPNPNQNPVLSFVLRVDQLFYALTAQFVDFTEGDNKVMQRWMITDISTILSVVLNYRKYEAPNRFHALLKSGVIYKSKIDRKSEIVSERDQVKMCKALTKCMKHLLEFSNYRSLKDVYERGVTNYLSSAIKNLPGGDYLPVSEEPAWISGTGDAAHETDHSRCAVLAPLLFMYELCYSSPGFVEVMAKVPFVSDEAADPAEQPKPSDAKEAGGAGAGAGVGAGSDDDDEEEEDSRETPVRTNNCLMEFVRSVITRWSVATLFDKDPYSITVTHLCSTLVIVVAENEQGSAALHYRIDRASDFTVVHKKSYCTLEKPVISSRVPLACAVVDVINCYLRFHLKENLDVALYVKSIGILHRMFCFQHVQYVSVPANWTALWETLMMVTSFLMAHQFDKPKVQTLLSQIVNVMNLVIMDPALLLTDAEYDELYYELIRSKDVCDLLISKVNESGSCKINPHSLGNIKAITSHFSSAINGWCISHEGTPPSHDEIIEIIKSNFDTLTLKMQEGLDKFERYVENPHEITFFSQMLRQLMCDAQTSAANIIAAKVSQLNVAI